MTFLTKVKKIGNIAGGVVAGVGVVALLPVLGAVGTVTAGGMVVGIIAGALAGQLKNTVEGEKSS